MALADGPVRHWHRRHGHQAAGCRMVTGSGADMVIANGAHPEVLYDIADGKPAGTRFKGRRQEDPA